MSVLQIDIHRMGSQRHAQSTAVKAPPVKKGRGGAGKGDKAKRKDPKGGRNGKSTLLNRMRIIWVGGKTFPQFVDYVNFLGKHITSHIIDQIRIQILI